MFKNEFCKLTAKSQECIKNRNIKDLIKVYKEMSKIFHEDGAFEDEIKMISVMLYLDFPLFTLRTEDLIEQLDKSLKIANISKEKLREIYFASLNSFPDLEVIHYNWVAICNRLYDMKTDD